MTKKRMIEIFENNSGNLNDWNGDSILPGLQILSKYTDDIITMVDYMVIYSDDINTLIEKKITEEDCKELKRLNWKIHNHYLACFL